MSVPKPLLDPTPVDFRSRIADLPAPVVVESAGADPLVILEVRPGSGGEHRSGIRITTQGEPDPTFVADVDMGMELGDFAVLHLPGKPVRAFSLPPGHIETRHNLRLGLARAAVGLFSLSIIPFIVTLIPGDTWRALLIAVAVTFAIAAMTVQQRNWRSAHHVYRTEAGTWPLSKVLDERPALQASTDAVDLIKQEYGRLLSDVIARIEQPALFDPAVETTRRFTSALIQWDDGEESLGAAERSTLAARVRLTFQAARDHADTVGMDHLPTEARERAARAAKVLRLAASSSSAGERESAQRRGMEILDSLMLYYLPRGEQARAMIAGRPLLALPGRQSGREDRTE